MTRAPLSAAFLALMIATLPARAQDAASPAADDLLALRFYVQQGDQTATASELRRLQLKYPQWVPPADLTRIGQTGPDREIDAIHAHIAEGRFEEARAAITAARTTWPDWTPPSEMMTLLETGEGQAELEAAFAAGDLPLASAIIRRVPTLLQCSRINNAWRIAEAQASAQRRDLALGTWRAVLSACSNPADIIATLEKADAVASPEELQALAAIASSRLPAQAAGIEATLQRLIAGHPGAPAATAPPTAKPAAPAKPAPAKPATAGAPTGSGGGSSGGGNVQSLAARGDWRGCMAAAAGSRNAGVIYQSGWCAYNLDRPLEAVEIFRRALGGKLDATQRRDANYGLALAYLKLGMTEDAARLAASVDFSKSQRLDIERQILDQRGVAAYRRGDWRKSIEYFDAMESLGGGIRRDLAILRGYALLNAGQRAKAREHFKRLDDQLSTKESRAGLNAASD